VKEIVYSIVQDTIKYNNRIEERLSKRNRVGRISRQDYWDAVPDARRLDKELGDEKIRKLREILFDIEGEPDLRIMTAIEFFTICSICYDSNKELPYDPKWTPKKKYEIHADMRDEGLTEIDEASEDAFREWYRSKRFGGHPWEICRGGSTTHISLRVRETENEKWQLILARSSFARVIETVNMALALHAHFVPFHLANAREIIRMVTGNDYLGLVPEGVRPKYCHDLFPEHDRIIDFMDPWFDGSCEPFQKFIYWYPLTPYALSGLVKHKI
jgi:hypothetical protein